MYWHTHKHTLLSVSMCEFVDLHTITHGPLLVIHRSAASSHQCVELSMIISAFPAGGESGAGADVCQSSLQLAAGCFAVLCRFSRPDHCLLPVSPCDHGDAPSNHTQSGNRSRSAGAGFSRLVHSVSWTWSYPPYCYI